MKTYKVILSFEDEEIEVEAVDEKEAEEQAIRDCQYPIVSGVDIEEKN